ncbi:MAG: cytochrome b, partial [Actinomycetota bacterium]
HTIPNPFFPGVLFPGLIFTVLYMWPFLEARLTGDMAAHNLLNRPRDKPLRTAFGTGALAFYLVLFLAGGNDVLAGLLKVSIETVTLSLRILLFVLPVVVGYATWRICKELVARGTNLTDEPHGHVVRRSAQGGYE